MYTVISTEDLTSILSDVSGLTGIEAGENKVFFSYRDTDGDDLSCCVHNLGDRIAFVLMINIPMEMFVSGVVCANKYNNSSTQGSFAYGTKNQDVSFVCLEQSVEFGTGVTRDYITFIAQNFVSKINEFESIVFEAMRELGNDENFIREGCGF